jgi:hypothetical protein
MIFDFRTILEIWISQVRPKRQRPLPFMHTILSLYYWYIAERQHWKWYNLYKGMVPARCCTQRYKRMRQQWIILRKRCAGRKVYRHQNIRGQCEGRVRGTTGERYNSAADPYSGSSAFIAVFGKIERNMADISTWWKWLTQLTTAGHGISNSVFPRAP